MGTMCSVQVREPVKQHRQQEEDVNEAAHVQSLLVFVPTEELTLWIQHVYRTYALDDAKERFPEFDTDRDGFVTWEEYNQVAHNQLISFDDDAVLDDPEQESLRYASILQLTRYGPGCPVLSV